VTPDRPAAGPSAATAVPGPVRRWYLGARPRTLPAALVPVVVGTAAAHSLSPLHGTGSPRIDAWWCALGALIVALAVQIGTNYANDYSDGIRGTDDVRVGPLRLVASGLASPSAVKSAALLSFGVAGVAGLGLAAVTSWWILPVGAACLAAGWLYTGGPRPYGYVGLGEVFVFVFFGLVATVGTFYVQTLRLDVAARPKNTKTNTSPRPTYP
jgi:1,4-dihydroxy-2-naphthoate octaprenyltransferase